MICNNYIKYSESLHPVTDCRILAVCDNCNMADDIEEPIMVDTPVCKKQKLNKPPDSCVKSAYHPSGSKFLNVKLWKHFKLARASQFNEWSLCTLCEQENRITWISRVDGATSKMMKHLTDEHKLYVKYS